MHPDQGAETLSNTITLTVEAHCRHGLGAVALRPFHIPEDSTELELEFCWLAGQQRKMVERMSLLLPPPLNPLATGRILRMTASYSVARLVIR